MSENRILSEELLRYVRREKKALGHKMSLLMQDWNGLKKDSQIRCQSSHPTRLVEDACGRPYCKIT